MDKFNSRVDVNYATLNEYNNKVNESTIRVNDIEKKVCSINSTLTEVGEMKFKIELTGNLLNTAKNDMESKYLSLNDKITMANSEIMKKIDKLKASKKEKESSTKKFKELGSKIDHVAGELAVCNSTVRDHGAMMKIVACITTNGIVARPDNKRKRTVTSREVTTTTKEQTIVDH
jgi:predicted  nucleic acid-binding Zn-ribbon protein